MSLDLRPLFTLPFWFDLGPQPPSDAVSTVVFAVFGVLLVGGIAARLLRRRASQKVTRVLIRRGADMTIWASVTALAWFFCHYEGVRFLGSRFWALLWIVVVVTAVRRYARFVRQDVPAMRARQEAKNA